MTISFRCPQCQSPCTAPPEMAGRKAKCLKCTQVIVVPNPERDRWPPGMEPPGMKQPAAAAAAYPAAHGKASAPPARPVSAKPAGEQSAKALPRAQPVVTPQAPAQPVTAQPVVMGQPVVAPQPPAAPAVPVAKAVPITPTASPAHIPVARPVTPPVAETVSEDIDDLLAFESAVPPSLSQEANPYRSPQTSKREPVGPAHGEIQRIIYGETLRTAWQIFKAQAGSLVGATLISQLAFAGVLVALRVLMMGIGLAVAALEIRSTPLAFVVVTLYLFAVVAAAVFFLLGYVRYVLWIARGKTPDLGTLFGGGSLLLHGILMGLMIVAAIVAGSLLIVGGLLAAITLVLAPVVLVDKEEGAWPSLALSARIMSQNFLPGFLLLLTIGMLGNLLITLTCGLGTLVVFPLQALLWSVIYLRATGRRTAAD